MMAFFRELEISKLRIYSLGSHELSGAPNTVDGSENPANMANNQLIWQISRSYPGFGLGISEPSYNSWIP